MKYEIVEYNVVDGKMDPNSGVVMLTDFANLMEVHEYMDVNFEPPDKHWMVRTKKEPVDLGDLKGPLEQAELGGSQPRKAYSDEKRVYSKPSVM